MGGLTAATAADVPESIIRMQKRPLTARGSPPLRSPHLPGSLPSTHHHRLLPGSYPATAGPLHPLSGGTQARRVRACSPLPARTRTLRQGHERFLHRLLRRPFRRCSLQAARRRRTPNALMLAVQRFLARRSRPRLRWPWSPWTPTLPVSGVLWHTPPRKYRPPSTPSFTRFAPALLKAHALDAPAHLPLGHFSADGRIFRVPAITPAEASLTPVCLSGPRQTRTH
jgi:hypothetical protein